VKGAQEAHEAIRPTETKREPQMIKSYLNANQYKLYGLIWQRMVASQMSPALYDNTIVDIKAECPAKTDYLLRTSVSIINFSGFTILYSEGKDEPSKKEDKVNLPPLAEADALKLLDLFPEQKFTQPPFRFTEATLIKMLEKNGIGRPSTYAPILSTIQAREYVVKENVSFHPTELGYVVNDLLCQYFPGIVDIKFTAHIEGELDEIAKNNRDWSSVIHDFYTPFEKNLLEASERIEKIKIPDHPIDEICPECSKPLLIKVGRFGKFIACSGYPDCKYTRTYQIKTGAKCPEDSGELIQRISKKKRTFYGCSNYPKCLFTTRFKPLPQPCLHCGGLLTVYRQKWAKCRKCDYKGKLDNMEISNKNEDQLHAKIP
jgi:DNA topoisomerase-1